MSVLERLIIQDRFDEVEKLVEGVDLPSVVIPSYKNREKCNIKNLVESSPTTKFMIFVYEDDLENYQQYLKYQNVELVIVPLDKIEYRGITPKRKFIINYLLERDYHKIIMLDDDTSTMFNRTIEQEGKRAGKKVPIDIWLSFKILIKSLEGIEYGIGGFYRDDFINFWSRKKILKLDLRATNAILINLDKFKEHNINYDTNFKTGEDCDIILQLYSKNVNTYCLAFLANTFTIKSGGKGSVSGTIDEWRKDWVKLFIKWKGFLDLKNFPESDKFKYKENHRKIYANDRSFKNEEHKHRYELAKQWNG